MKTQEIERIVLLQDLRENLQEITARINVPPLPEIFYVGPNDKSRARDAGIVSFDLPFKREPELYDGETRAKFFSEKQTRETFAEHAARVNAKLPNIALNPLAIYCAKTGAPIGAIDKTLFEQTIAIHGAQKAQDILFFANSNAYHPAWFNTESESLDRLILSDPQGYAIYAFNVLSGTKEARKQWTQSRVAEHHWALARAWQLLSFVPNGMLERVNDLLCACITFSPDATRKLQKLIPRAIHSPDQLAQLTFEGKLIAFLETSIEKTMLAIDNEKNQQNRQWNPNKHKWVYTKKRFEEVSTSPYDAARGPSNIRGQKRAQRAIARQTDISKLAAELTAGGFFGTVKRDAPKETFRDRLAKSALGITGLDLSEIDTSGLDGFSFVDSPDAKISDEENDEEENDIFSDDDEGEDNEIIIRPIPRALMPEPPKPQEKPQETGADLFARLQARKNEGK